MWIFVHLLFNSILGSLLSVLLAASETGENVLLPAARVENYNHVPREGWLTQKDLQAIREFRPIVNDVLKLKYEKTNQFLIRYLRASNFDFNAASRHIRKTQAWKKLLNWESLRDETFSPKASTFYADGAVDKKGNLITYVKLDDFRKYVMNGHSHNLTRYLLQFFEKSMNQLADMSIGNEEKDFGIFLILEAQGFNVKQHACYGCLNLYFELAKVSEVYFPQVMHHMVLLNVPPVGKPLLEVLKGVLSDFSKKTLHVFGFEPKKWTKFLLDHISPDQLSKRVGGERNNWY